jgi:hypothetical protein
MAVIVFAFCCCLVWALNSVGFCKVGVKFRKAMLICGIFISMDFFWIFFEEGLAVIVGFCVNFSRWGGGCLKNSNNGLASSILFLLCYYWCVWGQKIVKAMVQVGLF